MKRAILIISALLLCNCVGAHCKAWVAGWCYQQYEDAPTSDGGVKP